MVGLVSIFVHFSCLLATFPPHPFVRFLWLFHFIDENTQHVNLSNVYVFIYIYQLVWLVVNQFTYNRTHISHTWPHSNHTRLTLTVCLGFSSVTPEFELYYGEWWSSHPHVIEPHINIIWRHNYTTAILRHSLSAFILGQALYLYKLCYWLLLKVSQPSYVHTCAVAESWWQ